MHIWRHLIAPVSKTTISEIILKSNHSRKLSFDETIIGCILPSGLAHNDDVGQTIKTWYRHGTQIWILSNVGWTVVVYKSEEEQTVRYLKFKF